MKKKQVIKKIKQFLPWVFGALFVLWLIRRYTTVTPNQLASDSDEAGRTSIEIFDYKGLARGVDFSRTIYAANIIYWKGLYTDRQSIDAIANMGYGAILCPVEFEGVYDFETGLYNWKNTDERFKKCADRGLLIFPRLVYSMNQRNFERIFQKSDAALDTAGNYFAGQVQGAYLAPHSTKWQRFISFNNAFANRYREFMQKSHIEAVIMVFNETHEFGYTNIGETLGSGNYQTKHNTLKRLFNQLSAPFSGYEVTLDVGDLILTPNRAMFGYTDIAQKAKWLKQNPIFDSYVMDMDFVARQLQQPNKNSYIEITKETNDPRRSASLMMQAADRGIDVVGLAFADPPEGLAHLQSVMNEIKTAGYLTKPKPTLPGHTFTYKVSDMVAAGGYNSGVLSNFKAAYQGGVAPKIVVNYDL